MGGSRHEPVRVLIVNDYEVIVEGLRAMLAPFANEIEVVGVAWNDVPETAADIALFDTFASPHSSLSRIDALRENASISRIVLYSWNPDRGFTAAALATPVDAVISKSETGPSLVDMLVRISRGDRLSSRTGVAVSATSELSRREREVLALLTTGRSNRAIADELHLSIDTIKSHVRAAYKKLGVRNRTQAAVLAHRLSIDRVDQADRIDDSA